MKTKKALSMVFALALCLGVVSSFVGCSKAEAPEETAAKLQEQFVGGLKEMMDPSYIAAYLDSSSDYTSALAQYGLTSKDIFNVWLDGFSISDKLVSYEVSDDKAALTFEVTAYEWRNLDSEWMNDNIDLVLVASLSQQYQFGEITQEEANKQVGVIILDLIKKAPKATHQPTVHFTRSSGKWTCDDPESIFTACL